MTRRLLIVGVVVVVALVVVLVFRSDDDQRLELRRFGGQDFATPTYVVGAPADPGRVFVVEGGGRIRLVKEGATQDAPFLDISRDVCSPDEGCDVESGLFSMGLPPDYKKSGHFYVFYTRDAAQRHDLVVEEFRRSAANPDLADVTSRREVMVIPHPDGNYHNGGQLQFGPDDLLYIGVGDGERSSNAHSRATRLGKILRINPRDPQGPADYSIPRDNPFLDGQAGNNADEIYSYGLRNPWRFSFDRLTGDLAIGDVGYATREEIDLVPRGMGRGTDFGWDCVEGSRPYPDSETPSCARRAGKQTPPALEYVNPGAPEPAEPAASVVGGYVVRDGALPSLRGRYLYADSYDTFGDQLRSARPMPSSDPPDLVDDSGTGLTADFVVSFGEDACGHIYVASYNGTVSRIEPASGSFPCNPDRP